MYWRSPGIHWSAVVAVTLLALANLLLARSPFPYTPDSAGYFEQARNIVAEGTPVTIPYGIQGEGRSLQTLFPVGYPLLLALPQACGIDAQVSSVAIGWIASMLLPLCLFLTFRRSLGPLPALMVAALTVTSPGFTMHSGMGLTDTLSLLLATASIGLLLNGAAASSVLLAGILAGTGYAIRNAHAALLLSVAAWMAMRFLLLEPAARRSVLREALLFSAGAGLVVVPLMVRNVALFGSPNPYAMEPSTIDLATNTRTYIQEVVYDLTAHRELGRWVAWSLPGLVSLIGGGGWVIASLCACWKRLDAGQRGTVLLCALYALVGSVVVIAARTRFEWGEPINVRHTMQYVPFLFAILMPGFTVSWRRWAGGFAATIGLTLALVVVAHITYLVGWDRQRTVWLARAQNAESVFRQGASAICDAPREALLASNFAYVFRIRCAAPVREWEPPVAEDGPPGERSASFLEALQSLTRDRPGRALVIGLFRGRSPSIDGQLPLAEEGLTSLRESGWNVLASNPDHLLLSRRGD